MNNFYLLSKKSAKKYKGGLYKRLYMIEES